MSERTSEWPSTYVLILVCSRPQCIAADGNGDDDDEGDDEDRRFHLFDLVFVAKDQANEDESESKREG